MGKTFVALAIARRFPRRLIVAPAALQDMWRDAVARADLDAEIITFEKLSRSEPQSLEADLLILDESHHARNPGTRRYQRIAQLARNARVLMLTATPIHNRRADFVALLSLFLGSRANDLTESELSRCVVRRERRDTAPIFGMPVVGEVTGFGFPDDPDVVTRLMSLPPPLPASGSGSGGALINRGLIHQWSSSEAALRDALRRRVAKATVLIESLRAGRYPTAADLQSWTFADGALQLGFAELLSPPTSDAASLLESVLTHANALETFLNDYAETSMIDQVRARALSDIRKANESAKIVAFAQYGSTVSDMFRRLAGSGRVAMLTATGARVAGGKLSRQDVISRFAPRANRARPPSCAETVDLLLTTDLLSEGVNLQDSEIVVHLDIPWTAARMEQRVGRVARMGSQHSRVSVYQFHPPASAETVLRGEALVATKWDVARRVVGAQPIPPFESSGGAALSAANIQSRTEYLRAILGRWAVGESGHMHSNKNVHAAAVSAGESGFIAAGYLGNVPLLLTCRGETLSTRVASQITGCLLAEGSETSAERADYDAVLLAVEEWIEWHEGAESAGVAGSAPARRTRLLNRIDATLQRAPPHLRQSRARVVAAARAVAAAPHGAAIEKDLEALTDSPLSDDVWLHALAALAVAPRAQPARRADFQLCALLLLRP
jgi:hypothetical protein